MVTAAIAQVRTGTNLSHRHYTRLNVAINKENVGKLLWYKGTQTIQNKISIYFILYLFIFIFLYLFMFFRIF